METAERTRGWAIDSESYHRLYQAASNMQNGLEADCLLRRLWRDGNLVGATAFDSELGAAAGRCSDELSNLLDRNVWAFVQSVVHELDCAVALEEIPSDDD
jgi:hypothetical protein